MFPIRDTIPSRSFPLVNWSLIGINVLIFIYQSFLPKDQFFEFLYGYSLIPSELDVSSSWRLGSNMFLHGGVLHLLGNMWTLYIFGDNVEDRMGKVGYLAFYVFCGLGASLTHFLVDPTSEIPAVGASGAISGVMAAYMIMFPKSKIVILFPLLFIPLFFEISAFFYIGFWFVGQLISGTSTFIAPEGPGIAFWAHIGGFIFGLAVYWIFRKKNKYRPTFKDEYHKRFENYY